MYSIIQLLFIFCMIRYGFSSSDILFTGERYLEYKPSKSVFEQDNVNRIEVRFRTIHPSGLLVLMIGRYDSTLVLQIVQGKLRYSVAQRSKEMSQVIIGTNLNDNKWHEVKILRTGRVNEITLDKESKTILSPLSFERLSVSETFYIGGYNTFELRDIKNIVAARSKFIGCLNVKQIDNRDPIAYYQKGTTRIKAVPPGPVIFGCDNNNDRTFGFQSPSSNLVVELRQNVSNSLLSLSMSLRTFNLHGQIFATKKSKCSAKVGLANGKVFMEVLQDTERSIIAKIESRVTISDGQWHDLIVVITDTDIFLRIDENSRRSKSLYQTTNACRETRELVFGGASDYNQYGFVGCMNKIKFNKNYIQHNDHGDCIVRKTSVTKECKLVDKCYPNPCRNNARCSQTWKGYTCDCSGTNFYGLNCEVSIYKTSCAAYQSMGLTETSYCLIDPDSNGDLPPYTTLCKFDERRQAYTAVHHNKEDKFAATEGEDNFQHYTFHKFEYELDFSNIEALIQRSESCRQKVLFKCYNTALMNAPKGPPNVGWITRTGDVNSYWGGVTENNEGCACGVNKTCFESNKLCNCDTTNSNMWLEDSGYLSGKKNLPITRLNVVGIKVGAGFFQIGPLECFGEKENTNNDELSSVPKDTLQRVCMTINKKKELVKTANDTKAIIQIEPEIQVTSPPKYTKIIGQTTEVPGNYLPSDNIVSSYNSGPPKVSSSGKSLSILEMVLIGVAGLAVLILVVKFVFCNIFGKLYGQVILNPDTVKARCGSPSSAPGTMNSTVADGGTAKKKGKNPLSAYWV